MATGPSLPNFTFHLLNHYLTSLNYLKDRQKVTGESLDRSQMVEKGHVTHQSSIPANLEHIKLYLRHKTILTNILVDIMEISL